MFLFPFLLGVGTRFDISRRRGIIGLTRRRKQEGSSSSFAVDSVKVYALDETVSGKRVIWRDFCETLRHGERTGHLVFPGPKGARGGVVAFPLGSGDGRFTIETCRYDSNETLAVVRYYVESSKTGKLFLGRADAGNPVELNGTPGRWHEAVVSLGEKGSAVQYLGSSLWVQTEGFDQGDALYIDEVRLLEM